MKSGNSDNFTHRLRVALLLPIAVICIISACGTKSANDDTLATHIKANLSSDPTTKSANVNVAVKNGVVTLTGDVPSSDVELQAMKIANSTAGVQRVDDQMKVNAALAMNQPVPENSQAQPPPAPAPPSQPEPTSPAPAPQPPASQTPVTPAPAPPPPTAPVPETPPEPVRMTIPAGEHVTVRMIDSIDSDRNEAGQVFRASLVSPLTSRGRVVVPAGATVIVLLEEAKNAGRIRGRSELEIRLSRLEYHGRSYPLASSLYEEQGKGRGGQTAKRTGIGAVAGAVIGAIAGGGKGAAIGSVVGGGGAAGYQLFTHGQKVKIPSETILTFRLTAPVTIEKRPNHAG
jgi:hypothetical protein